MKAATKPHRRYVRTGGSLFAKPIAFVVRYLRGNAGEEFAERSQLALGCEAKPDWVNFGARQLFCKAHRLFYQTVGKIFCFFQSEPTWQNASRVNEPDCRDPARLRNKPKIAHWRFGVLRNDFGFPHFFCKAHRLCCQVVGGIFRFFQSKPASRLPTRRAKPDCEVAARSRNESSMRLPDHVPHQ